MKKEIKEKLKIINDADKYYDERVVEADRILNNAKIEVEGLNSIIDSLKYNIEKLQEENKELLDRIKDGKVEYDLERSIINKKLELERLKSDIISYKKDSGYYINGNDLVVLQYTNGVNDYDYFIDIFKTVYCDKALVFKGIFNENLIGGLDTNGKNITLKDNYSQLSNICVNKYSTLFEISSISGIGEDNYYTIANFKDIINFVIMNAEDLGFNAMDEKKVIVKKLSKK